MKKMNKAAVKWFSLVVLLYFKLTSCIFCSKHLLPPLYLTT